MELDYFPENKLKTGSSRGENLKTQAPLLQKVFNRQGTVTVGWYPVMKAKKLKKGESQSFTIMSQRIVIFRGQDNVLRAIDAFCPHMGADLGHGKVIGNRLQCYFHQWTFGDQGQVLGDGYGKSLECQMKNKSYPIKERLSYIWIYSSDDVPTHDVICPKGLEGHELYSKHLMARKLFVHHHVMMVNGIDLQHFRTVHHMDLQLDFQVTRHSKDFADWEVSAPLPSKGWRAKLARFFMGEEMKYVARFAGGSQVAVSYGQGLHLQWGCVPLPSGISIAHAFFITEKKKGLKGFIRNRFDLVMGLFLLLLLKDDDQKAFPNMRFDTRGLTSKDKSVSEFVKFVNEGSLSPWSAS